MHICLIEHTNHHFTNQGGTTRFCARSIIFSNLILLHNQTYNISVYADDTILYACGSSPGQVMSRLQSAFNVPQASVKEMKADKTK